jgi:hypothetical protein
MNFVKIKIIIAFLVFSAKYIASTDYLFQLSFISFEIIPENPYTGQDSNITISFQIPTYGRGFTHSPDKFKEYIFTLLLEGWGESCSCASLQNVQNFRKNFGKYLLNKDVNKCIFKNPSIKKTNFPIYPSAFKIKCSLPEKAGKSPYFDLQLGGRVLDYFLRELDNNMYLPSLVKSSVRQFFQPYSDLVWYFRSFEQFTIFPSPFASSIMKSDVNYAKESTVLRFSMIRTLKEVDIHTLLLIFEDEDITSQFNNFKLGHLKGLSPDSKLEKKNKTSIAITKANISENDFYFEIKGFVNPKEAGSYSFTITAFSNDSYELEKGDFKIRVEKDTRIPFYQWGCLILFVSFVPMACGTLLIINYLEKKKLKLVKENEREKTHGEITPPEKLSYSKIGKKPNQTQNPLEMHELRLLLNLNSH